MTVPNLLDTWRVTYNWDVGTPVFKVQTVVHVTAGILEDPQGVANEAGAAWMAAGSLFTKMANVAIGRIISVQPFDGSTAPTNCTVSGFTGTAMGGTGNAVSAQTAWIITKRTLLAGRRHRGRMYVAAGAQTSVDPTGSQWTSSAVTGVQSSANTYLSQIKGGPLISNLVVYSHKFNEKANVSSLLVRQYLGTQRRRTSA